MRKKQRKELEHLLNRLLRAQHRLNWQTEYRGSYEEEQRLSGEVDKAKEAVIAYVDSL